MPIVQRSHYGRAAAALLFLFMSGRNLCAQTDSSAGQTQDWAVHGQLTFLEQFHPSFTSPYRGPNSLDPGNRGDETVAADLFTGARPWEGGEIWADSQILQGFGFNNTLGLAAFPNGESAKVGSAVPYFRLQRLFFRQTIDLGGDKEDIEPGAYQLAGTQSANHLTFTAGKIAVVDIFDTNDYAHDASKDFLNWAVIDAGAFDYAADSWGFSYGGVVEWTQDWWTLRGGLFDLSKLPNGKALETGFRQFAVVVEGEERHKWLDRDGKLKLLVYMNRGWMGGYDDAVALAERTGTIPQTALVRNYKSRPGAALNFQQEIADNLGVFARASYDDGSQEAFEFTEINRGVSGGVSLKGSEWNRKDDTVGAAYFVEGISTAAQQYFAHGGLGILIGDGRLPQYGLEKGIETYYSAQIAEWFAASADYQLVVNPAYNPQRGPVSIFSARLHAEF
ncbi:MAG TPA: carbohydrate porin [Rhizomicrobium sp.]|jgi:high affinity Mn2+ porin|nr:carbohydrate porin [Rhizomicrobium sp.]